MFIETGKDHEALYETENDGIIACHPDGSINYAHYDQRARIIRSRDFHTSVKRAKTMLILILGRLGNIRG